MKHIMKKKLAIVLGIRPDIIRASLVLKQLFAQDKHEIVFIWSGQHYSDNLKEVFFQELDVPRPSLELGATGDNDAEVVSDVMRKLYPVLEELKPEAVMFLGDTNTIVGSIAAAQLNIPIVHFEGCWSAYDWRMPETKYRNLIDQLSDVVYTYFPEYKYQGMLAGLNPKNIVVTYGNPIVEILDTYYFNQKEKFDAIATQEFFKERGIEKGEYYLMTWHRRENVHIRSSFEAILKLIGSTDRKIYLPLSYRTQKVLKEYGLALPPNVIMVDPIGYMEIVALIVNSRGVITDSGTIVEETCVLQVPSLQMRKATERPQVYDVGSSVKFDPAAPEKYPAEGVFKKFEGLYGKTWHHGLGDGKASERIAQDLLWRLDNDAFRMHKPEDHHLWIERSYREDGLTI
ncbi:MAG: UDP-N-acetylglucosamine 2-epimerase [Parcubacteria group bacterium GW2011_GWC2_45_7]|nr:MAG: UDP-N-acetylglucosamine 2-epimerase [Parcubacteria group bacterium GW2011_GWC2_45_7]KKU74104.1 MAG: UDP-N-acetylglucosamine 2-epimerase [Parcubacteria group bacterium GW2011_GWA2_47_26]